jgi:hypothetical protein
MSSWTHARDSRRVHPKGDVVNAIDKAVETRAKVRISARNGWAPGVVGMALGYRAKYDNVKVGFVDDAGNYTGEYTMVPAKSVEVVDEAAAEAPREATVNNNFRETTVRVFGVERVVHTELKTTVKALESAHMKAVKAALDEMRVSAAPAYAERVRTADRDAVVAEISRTHDYYDAQKLVSRNGGASGTRVLRERLVTKFQKRRFTAGSSAHTSARKPLPKVSYTVAPAGLASGLTEVAPGEYIDAPDDAPRGDWLSFWQ